MATTFEVPADVFRSASREDGVKRTEIDRSALVAFVWKKGALAHHELKSTKKSKWEKNNDGDNPHEERDYTVEDAEQGDASIFVLLAAFGAGNA